jgi:4-hydroxyacetophenone monooxygenase
VAPNPLYLSDISPAVARLFAEVPFYMGWYRFVLFWRFGDPLHASIVVEDDWPHKDRAVSRQNDRHRRFLERYILAQLEGRPDLVAKAVPTYPAYGKRMLLDNEWFKTLRRDDVELVVDPIARIERDGVVTEDGARRAADVLVMATGFQSTRILWPTEIRGRGGQSIHDAWRGDDPRAYLGLTTVGFPNLFIMLGPNTALAHGGSAIFQIEAQAQYLVSLLVAMREAGVATVEPRQDVHDDYNDRVDAANQRLVFAHPGMSNWYKNAAGRVVSVSPWRLVDFWHMTRKPDLADYVTHARTPREEVA